MAITTLGSFSGANGTDTSKRIPAAISALNKALAGDAAALAYMQQQSLGSATAVGKEAFRRALAIYDQQKPVVASVPAPTLPVAIVPPPVAIRPPVLLPSPPYVPPASPGSSVTKEGPGAAPIGFDTSLVSISPVPVVPSIQITGIRPHVITPINVGSDGGVITGPPAPELSGPASAPLAPASFGFVPPGAVDVTGATTTATPKAPSDNKIVLFLVAAVLLYAFVESKRK